MADTPEHGEFTLRTPDSSLIAEARYNTDTKVLVVRLQPPLNPKPGQESGRVYRFEDVPYSLWRRYSLAESKGAFFNQEIRRTYRGVEETQPVTKGAA